MRIALSMQLGGAVGNLIDRVTIGHVTDFISVGNFAVFNIADASVTGGVVCNDPGTMASGTKKQTQSYSRRKCTQRN